MPQGDFGEYIFELFETFHDMLKHNQHKPDEVSVQ